MTTATPLTAENDHGTSTTKTNGHVGGDATTTASCNGDSASSSSAVAAAAAATANGETTINSNTSNSNTNSIKENKKVYAIKPCVKDYAWGIRGMDSRVARYALESGLIDEVDPDTPYAELWIGTHPKGPSMICANDDDCDESATSSEAEKPLRDAIGQDLPFLLKVLSAGKALSIQAHPDKETAEKLNEENPQAYADSNHKPEMAIALTPFEAMCGFRRLEEVSLLIKKHPEFANCISQEAKLAVFLSRDVESQKDALRQLFTSFMSCPEDTARRNLNLLLIRLQAEQSTLHPHPHDEPAWERKCARAILRLAQQFPGDPGAMAPLFLNYLLIAPGESFFMAANEPHAYVAGEIIECMACSDNVVRAGLTPKYKDVENLVNMLTYSMGGPTIDAGAYDDEHMHIVRYTPPVPEFEVLIATIDPGDTLKLDNPRIPAVILMLEGSGTMDGQLVRPGRVYYWPAAAGFDDDDDSDQLVFSVPSEKRGPLKFAIAHRNKNITKPTAVNREDFGSSHHTPSLFARGRVSVAAGSPMPYLGNMPSPAGSFNLKSSSASIGTGSYDQSVPHVPSLV